MHILILGAGALGSLLGARLSQTQAEVSLLSTNSEHIGSIRENGLLVQELDGSIRRFQLDGFDDPTTIRKKADLIIVAVKSHATKEAVSSVRDVCCQDFALFLTLQNGIGNSEQIAEVVGESSVILGSTSQGATLVSPGNIRHGGDGPTLVGEIDGTPTGRVRTITELFRQAGLKAEASSNMKQIIWEKLIINVGINALTALTGIRNGLIAEIPEAGALSRLAVLEAVQVARSRGLNIKDDMADRTIAVARATAANRSSMGQDVDRRKRTEIDFINGAVVRFAEEALIPVPINRTLTCLIKIMECSFTSRA